MMNTNCPILIAHGVKIMSRRESKHTHVSTPHCMEQSPLEELTVIQPVKKLSTFYGI